MSGTTELHGRVGAYVLEDALPSGGMAHVRRAREEGYRDVEKAYRSARKENPGVPVCAVGESSGGHLALMLAAREDLACVDRALRGIAVCVDGDRPESVVI